MKGEFKHFNLKVFNIDSLSENEKRLGIYGDGKIYGGQDFYFSSQENKRGLIELTIYGFYLGEITEGFEITYLVYSFTGELISSFRVASKFEGNGYFSRSWGNFLDKGTYELYSEFNGQNGELDKKTYSKTITKIKPDGKIEQQTFEIQSEKYSVH